MEQSRFLILGAGPTGLGAAYRLTELGITDFAILEQTDHPGGLASSFVDEQGFTWDIGGHVQFSHYDYFDDLMIKALGREGWFTHQRESWAWMEDRFIPYPVQNNLRHLPREKMWRCMEGLIAANSGPASATTPANFREWIVASFGAGLAETFMLPYNFKVWAYPPEQLTHTWVGDRVATTDWRRVLQNVLLAQDDIAWGPNRTFRFPRRGGTGAIWRGVADLIGSSRIRYATTVQNIDTDRRVVQCEDGRQFRYEIIISTLPLDIITSMLNPQRRGLQQAAARLCFSSSNIVGLGMRGEVPANLRTKCWIYFPEGNCPFYRTTVFSNYSPANVPESGSYWSLMTETSESPGKAVDHARLVEHTVQGCINTRLIDDRSQVVSTWSYRAAHGYPTPTLQRDEILSFVLPGLEKLNIFNRGRFGAWKYEVSNQDHSVMQGVEVVDFLVHGKPETTLPFPARVNARVSRG